jgi:hypothetical protein
MPPPTRNPEWRAIAAFSIALATGVTPRPSTAQNDQPSEQAQPASQPAPEDKSVTYHPPLRGAPGGRVGGASRGSTKLPVPLPTIELVAPDDQAGRTADPSPTLYFFASGPVTYPTQLTISAALRPAPVLEATIPSPRAEGLYAARLADYRVRLEPGVAYTWSVSIVVDPKAWSRNVVASASMVYVATPVATGTQAVRAATTLQRAALFAQDGFWYDAVAAAADARTVDHHAALDGLMEQVGLKEPAAFDRAHQ